jgi:hypothetical protein
MSRLERTMLSEQDMKLALPKTPFALVLDEIVNEADLGEENPAPAPSCWPAWCTIE